MVVAEKEKNVSDLTQNLAFNSILMFFRLVFNQGLGDFKNTVRVWTGQNRRVYCPSTK
jgi:hypothetical protein